MGHPNYNFRRRIAVQFLLWAVLGIVIGAITFTGCNSEPEQSHRNGAVDPSNDSISPVTDKVQVQTPNQNTDTITLNEWAYAKVDWTDPKQRLSVVVLQLKQLDEDLENYRNKYSKTYWRIDQETLIQYHQARVQLLFQISAEAQNVLWNTN